MTALARRSPFAALGLAGLLCVASGCGGGGGGGGDGAVAPSTAVPGSISIDNMTGYEVEIAFLDEFTGLTPRIVRVRLQPNEVGPLLEGDLPAAAELVLDIALGPTADGHRVRRKLALTVDGDLVVRVQLADPEDPFSLEMEALRQEG